MRFQYSLRKNNPVDEQRDRELEDHLDAMLGDGTWTAPLGLGVHSLWVDATGDLRIKATAPTSDLDGTVVGTQT